MARPGIEPGEPRFSDSRREDPDDPDLPQIPGRLRGDRRHGDPRGSTTILGGSAPGGRFSGRTLGRVEEGAIAALLIGSARVSTDEQDLTAQRDALTSLA